MHRREFPVLITTFVGALALAGRVMAAAPGDDLAARVAQLTRQMDSSDAAAHHRAAVELRNLPGSALAAIEARLSDQTLGADARSELGKAMELLRKRGAVEAMGQASVEAGRRSALEAYDAVGLKDPRWNAAAKEAIRLFMRVPFDPDRPPEADEKLLQAFRNGEEAGCVDPLFIYFYARVLADIGSSPPADLEVQFQTAAMGMRNSRYPAYRKCHAYLQHAGRKLQGITDSTVSEAWRVDEYLVAALELFPQAAADPEMVPSDVLNLAELELSVAASRRRFVLDSHRNPPDRKGAFDIVYPAMEKRFAGTPYPLIFKGEFYTDYAWDARGTGYANNVTPEGWKLMSDRLQIAEAALKQAAEHDVPAGWGATAMITVKLGQGDGRAAMEAWFKRAMETNPDNFNTCWRKLYYLEPQWNGSPEIMLAFGRECRATENWRARIPMILASAHLELAQQSGNPGEYFSQPNVWDELQSLYEAYLSFYPNGRLDRSNYAKIAAASGHWDVAAKQLDMLGDHPAPVVFPDPAAYAALRQQARERAGIRGPGLKRE